MMLKNEERKEAMEEAQKVILDSYEHAKKIGMSASSFLSFLPFMPVVDSKKAVEFIDIVASGQDAACWRELCSKLERGEIEIRVK